MGVARLTDQNTIVPDSKYACIERERRYLLQDLPEGLTRADHHLQITDNYLTGTRLRIRIARDPKTPIWIMQFTQKSGANPEDRSRTLISSIDLNALKPETLDHDEANEMPTNRYRLY